MPKKAAAKTKKRNVLGELKDGCPANVEPEVAVVNEFEVTKEIVSKKKKNRVTFQLDDDDSNDADNPEALDDQEALSTCVDAIPITVTSEPQKKKRNVKTWSNLKKIPFELICEWKDCNYSNFCADEFIKHVGEHIPEFEVREVEELQAAVYFCLWGDCETEILTSNEAIRHVYYHGYHTKLKSIGARLMDDENHPKCVLDPDTRNLLIELPASFQCCWETCDVVLENVQRFYYHVYAHAVCFFNGVGKGNGAIIRCQWRGCRSKCKGLQRLGLHLRVHTKEKAVACPNCGATLASKTKFFDHCSRQAPKETNEFQCSHCNRSYQTERLLRDHMRHHINSYKCPFCDMTSPTPSSLSLHIRNRHISDRPFKCEHCSYRAKTQHNLLAHMSTHYSQALYYCEAEDCDFSCRTQGTLFKHLRRMHKLGREPVYCCHICDERYVIGQSLSRHLIKKHNFRLPTGHSRFRYKSDAEGLYHLETVRYESLEVTQEMIHDEEIPAPEQEPTIIYVGNNECAPTPAPVYISYDALDSEGNVTAQILAPLPPPIQIPITALELQAIGAQSIPFFLSHKKAMESNVPIVLVEADPDPVEQEPA